MNKKIILLLMLLSINYTPHIQSYGKTVIAGTTIATGMHIIKNIIYNVIKDSESEITQTNSNLVNSFLSIAGICSIPFLQSYLKNKSHQAAKDNNDKEEPSFLSSPLTKKISSSLAFSITYYLLSTTNTVGLPDND